LPSPARLLGDRRPSRSVSIAPGQSITVTVTFAPTASGTFHDSVTFVSSAGSIEGPAVRNHGRARSPRHHSTGARLRAAADRRQRHAELHREQRRRATLTITRSKPPSTR
jgi:hypothetical protein